MKEKIKKLRIGNNWTHRFINKFIKSKKIYNRKLKKKEIKDQDHSK